MYLFTGLAAPRSPPHGLRTSGPLEDSIVSVTTTNDPHARPVDLGVARRTRSRRAHGADPSPAEAYLDSLVSGGSRQTMASALRAIARLVFGGALLPEEVPWWELRPADVARIRATLSRSCGSPSTANVRLAALRGVMRECWRAGLMGTEEYHRAVDLRPVSGRRVRRGRHLEPGELETLFGACDDSARGHRDRAMLALLFGLGLRRSELAAVDFEDLDLESGRVMIRRGKGNRERVEYVPDGAREALTGWLRMRGLGVGPLLAPVVGRASSGTERVRDRRLSPQTIYDSVRRLFHRAGVRSFSPHDARRTFIAGLLDAGVDISTVARTVGHAQVTTTSLYDRRGERAVRNASTRVRLPVAAWSVPPRGV